MKGTQALGTWDSLSCCDLAFCLGFFQILPPAAIEGASLCPPGSHTHSVAKTPHCEFQPSPALALHASQLSSFLRSGAQIKISFQICRKRIGTHQEMGMPVTFLNCQKPQGSSSLQERPVLAHSSEYSFHHGEDGMVASVAFCCGKNCSGACPHPRDRN